MSLYKTELRRLVMRRFTRWMALIALLVLVAIALGTAVSNSKVGPEQLAAAERMAEENYRESLAHHQEFIEECKRSKESGRSDFSEDCEAFPPPSREDFLVEWYLPPTFDFRNEFGEYILAFAAIMSVIAFVLGASFIGAEWASGGMMNLLLWRPQRLRVLFAKAGALLTGLIGFTAVAALAWTAAFWVIAKYRGVSEGMTSGAWKSFALTELRGLIMVLVAGLIGFALASVGRHTAMALGAALGVVVVGQFGLGMVLMMANVRYYEVWLLPTYVLAWIQKKVTLFDYNSCDYSAGYCQPKTMDIVWQDAGVLFSAIVVLLFGTAMWMMRRRDIA